MARARAVLVEMEAMLEVGLSGPAARSAYSAAMHAAQALIFERLGRVARTHSGVHAEFAKLTRELPQTDPDLRSFLGRAYRFKTASDYSVGAEAIISLADATEAARIAGAFVSWIDSLLSQR